MAGTLQRSTGAVNKSAWNKDEKNKLHVFLQAKLP